MEEKKIKPYKEKPLDEWVELNKLAVLKSQIRSHCYSVLEHSDTGTPMEDAMLLTRLIMTSLRDWYNSRR